jgi:hypothetical protein
VIDICDKGDDGLTCFVSDSHKGYGWTHCQVTYEIVVCNFINMPLILELGWDFFYVFFAGNDMVFVALAVIAIIGYISTLEPFLPQSTFGSYH